MQKHLIIIPGIGDDHPVYHLGARVFRLFGYTTHVRSFAWDDADPENYTQKYDEYCDFVASLSGEHYILGVSAGGALANTIAHSEPKLVSRVVTLCSPYTPFKTRVNPLLEASLRASEAALSAHSSGNMPEVVSLYALADQTVPKSLSKPHGIRAYPLVSVIHAVTILLGLTLYAPVVAYFLKQR